MRSELVVCNVSKRSQDEGKCAETHNRLNTKDAVDQRRFSNASIAADKDAYDFEVVDINRFATRPKPLIKEVALTTQHP